MDKLLAVLPANGAEMEFSAFVTAARVAGARPELWRDAKKKNLITARIDENGAHMIALVIPPAP